MATTVRFAFLDFEGEKSSLGAHLLTDGSESIALLQGMVDDIEEVLVPMTVCGFHGSSIAVDGDTATTTGTSGSGTPNSEDKAILEFASQYLTVRVSIPGPVDTIFMADKETVDPADALVQAFVAMALEILADKANHAIVALVRGWRARRS